MYSIFQYDAVTADGHVERGTLDAESSERAREALTNRGWFVVSIAARGERRTRRNPISAADLALGLRILGDLLDSGLPVGRALVILEGLAPRAWRTALPGIRESIREGRGLSDALSDASIEIPPLVLGIARAGEAGSGIAAAVRRAAELCEVTADTRAAIRSALAYPTIVAGAGIVAVTVLLTVVLPRFAKILADLGQALPASTQLVIHLSNGARASALPGLLSAALIIGAWRAWTATDEGRRTWHRLLLDLPLVGAVRRAAASARVAHALGALLESGVPVATALTHASRAAGDAELERRLLHARRIVADGESLSHAMTSADASTPTTIRLARAGEEAGRLPSMLTHAARIEQQRADRTVRTAVRMLEPMLLLSFASIVALVAAALLQAIYSVRPTG